MTPPKGGAHVAGVLLLDQKKLAEKLLGADVIRRALEAMPAESRAELEALLPMSWVSIGAAQDFHVAVAEVIGEDPKAWHRRLTRLGLESTFNGLWRMLVRLASVEAIVKRATVVYARSYDRGKLEASVAPPGRIRATLTEWPDIPDFELDAIVSGIEAALHIANHSKKKIAVMRFHDRVEFEIVTTA